MNSRPARALGIAGALALVTLAPSPAAAQSRVDTVTYRPDRGLLRTGAWTLGLSYVPALVVGVGSPLPADRYLLAPVAGPWLDLAKRECPDCRNETLNKVLLVVDGVAQGVGAAEIVGAFLFVERTVTSRPASKRTPSTALDVRFVPTRMAGGYGMNAVGRF